MIAGAVGRGGGGRGVVRERRVKDVLKTCSEHV